MQLPLIGKVDKRQAPWMVGVAAVGLVALSAGTVTVMRNAAPAQNMTELTIPAESKNLTVQITASGTIVPIQTVNLSPKSAGRVAELRVEQGDRVQQGQIIARMESRTLEAERLQALASLAETRARLAETRAGSRSEEVAQAQSNLELARGQVREAQTRLDLAQERVRRNQVLADEGAIARDRLDEVLSEERAARASLEQAEARVREAGQRLTQRRNGNRPEQIAQTEAQVAAALGRLQAVDTQLEDTLIRAPFSGIVTQKYATEGAFVTPTTSASSTSSATSTSIVALARGVEVLAKVPEVDIGQIKVNQTVEIKADAYPDQVFKGKVRLVAPEAVVEQNVTSFQVRVEMLTGKEKLRSGMNVDLTFLGNQLNNALIVPTVAIVTNQGQTGVLILGNNNKPRFQSVTTGATIGNQTQILEGLNAGDRVFVELPEGQKLEDITRGMQQAK